MKSAFISFIFIFSFVILSMNATAEVSGLAAPRFGSPLNLPAFAKVKSDELSFSRSFFENRFLLGIDPIFNIIDPQFDANLYHCLESQVDELTKIFSNPSNAGIQKPNRIHVTVMEVSGDLVKGACRPDMAVMSDFNYLIQICYSRPFAGAKDICRPLEGNELLASIKRYSADAPTKEKIFNSLKTKSENLLQLLSK